VAFRRGLTESCGGAGDPDARQHNPSSSALIIPLPWIIRFTNAFWLSTYQTQAFVCEADELSYGGEAPGGKTDLGIGLALTEHRRSLLLRRINKDAVKIKPRIEEIRGHDAGYNG
jgi:hypothetical protein